MRKIDGRTLSHEALEHLRKLAVQRVRDGERPSAIMHSFGFSRTVIYKWLRAEKKGGEAALASTKGTGRPPTLSPKQKLQVRGWINGKDPRQYGFDFGLWTRKVIRQLIWDRWRIDLGLTAIGRMLAELDITPQKPLRRAYERDPIAIARWEKEEFPRIRARAKRRGAELFFLDEAGIRSDAVLGRTWGIRGQTPVVQTSGQRQSVNAISVVSPRGSFWFETFTDKLDAPKFVSLLRRLRRARGRRPIFIILDGHPSHRAKLVARYVQSLRGKLELHFLPGYAPDLNPDEFVWNHIRHVGVTKKPLEKGESLRARVHDDLRKIGCDRSLVRSFFRAKSVAYITD